MEFDELKEKVEDLEGRLEKDQRGSLKGLVGSKSI
jgi:hypothetical protein